MFFILIKDSEEEGVSYYSVEAYKYMLLVRIKLGLFKAKYFAH